MTKERKTARELEMLIYNEACKARECEGMTRVTVREIADHRVDYNWQISNAKQRGSMKYPRLVAIAKKLLASIKKERFPQSVPPQPCECHCGDRSLCGSDPDVRVPVCVSGGEPWSTTAVVVRGNSASDGGVASATDCGGIPVGHGTAVPSPRQ